MYTSSHEELYKQLGSTRHSINEFKLTQYRCGSGVPRFAAWQNLEDVWSWTLMWKRWLWKRVAPQASRCAMAPRWYSVCFPPSSAPSFPAHKKATLGSCARKARQGSHLQHTKIDPRGFHYESNGYNGQEIFTDRTHYGCNSNEGEKKDIKKSCTGIFYDGDCYTSLETSDSGGFLFKNVYHETYLNRHSGGKEKAKLREKKKSWLYLSIFVFIWEESTVVDN